MLTIMGRGLIAGAAALGALVCWQAPAAAQSLVTPTEPPNPAPSYNRGRNVSVQDRPRPAYGAIGGRVGGFLLFPRVQSELELTDNLYAADNDRESDVVLRVGPEIRLRSDWSRNDLELYAKAARSHAFDNARERFTAYEVGGQGRAEVAAGQVFGGGSFGQFVEPRTELNARRQNIEPTEYELARAYVGGNQTFARTRFSGRLDLRDFDFQDGRDVLGGVVELDDRDQTQIILSGKAEYGVSPDTAAFVELAAARRDYDTPIPGRVETRSSDSLELTAGVNFDLTQLARGEFQAGVTRRSFEAASFGDVTALAARGRLEYFPTQLTTVMFDLNRRVEDAADVFMPGSISTDASVRVDHELLRNVILTARLGLGWDDFEGVDRQVERMNASLSAVYLLNRRLGLRLSYIHQREDGSGLAARPGFEVNRLVLGTVVQF
jgi:hypothetical protein